MGFVIKQLSIGFGIGLIFLIVIMAIQITLNGKSKI